MAAAVTSTDAGYLAEVDGRAQRVGEAALDPRHVAAHDGGHLGSTAAFSIALSISRQPWRPSGPQQVAHEPVEVRPDLRHGRAGSSRSLKLLRHDQPGVPGRAISSAGRRLPPGKAEQRLPGLDAGRANQVIHGRGTVAALPEPPHGRVQNIAQVRTPAAVP